VTKQASSPPTRDKGTPVAPPRPPGWRHYLWLVALGIFILLFYVLPATQSATQVALTYTQFMSDVSAHKVKTVTLNTDSSATGTSLAATSSPRPSRPRPGSRSSTN